MPSENDGRGFKNSLAAPILLMAVCLLLLGSQYIDVTALEYRDNIYLSVIILQLMVFMLPGVFYCKLKGPGYTAKMNFRLLTPRTFPFIIFTFFAMLFGAVLIKLGLYKLGMYTGEYAFFYKYAPSGTGGAADIAYAVIAYGVLPAVAEEFVFRSVLMTEYTAQYGPACAVLLTSFMYALPGFSLPYFPLYIFCGLLLGYAAGVTRSVFSAMIIRMGFNLTWLFFEGYLGTLLRRTEDPVFLAFVLTAAALFFMFLSFGEAERLYYVYSVSDIESIKPEAASSPFGRRIAEGALSPTMLLCVLIFVFGTLPAF